MLVQEKRQPLSDDWVDRRPVSAWDMFRIWPIQIVEFFRAYDRLREKLREDPADPATCWAAAQALRVIADDYEKLTDIDGPPRTARRLADRIQRRDTEDASARLDELLETFKDELGRRIFCGFTREEARLLIDADLPEGVASRFPLAAREIGDASRCLGFGMPTASAFHSLRALEVVLNAILQSLQLDRDQNWQTAIDQIESALRKRREDKKAWGEWLDQWDNFYTGLAVHYYYLKNAKRNPTMHWSTDTIDDQRARQLREHTIQLIEAVAERLSELPPTEPEPPLGKSPGDAQS